MKQNFIELFEQNDSMDDSMDGSMDGNHRSMDGNIWWDTWIHPIDVDFATNRRTYLIVRGHKCFHTLKVFYGKPDYYLQTVKIIPLTLPLKY